MEITCVYVPERPEPQVPLERVPAIELEGRASLGRLHEGDVFEAVAEAEGAVVVEIVAQELIGGGRLRRDGLEGRMRVEHRHHGEPAAVGDAEHADAAVVVRHVLEQPVDRVVSVGAFVDGLGVAPVARRPAHDELPLGLEAAADVLENKNVALVDQVLQVFAEEGRRALNAVRRAQEDERQLAASSFGREDGGVESHAVTHGDHGRRLGEAIRRFGRGLLRRDRCSGKQNEGDGEQSLTVHGRDGHLHFCDHGEGCGVRYSVKRNFNVGILLPFCELCHRIRDSCTTTARVV